MNINTQPGMIPDDILDLLALKATNKIDAAQARQLDQWLIGHPEHEAECHLFFVQMQKHYWAHLSAGVDVNKGWKAITSARYNSPKPTAVMYRWIAAAALFILMIAATWYMVITFHDKQDQPLVEAPALERQNKAVLVLSDGRELALDSENKTRLLEEGGIHITNNPGDILAYNAPDEQPSEPIVNKLRIPAGARYQLQLSDGTHVWLNADSEIEYPVAFGKTERRIRLSGEAYFDVQSNPANPFIIESNGYELTVTGTSFNVSSYQHDPHMQTTLVEGKVVVKSRNGDKITLHPGEMITVNNTGQNYTVETVDTRFYTSWKEGILYFNKVTLYDLSVKLGRWYGADFQFTDEQKKKLVYSGALENSRDIRFLLNLIEQTADVKFMIDGKTVMVK